MTKKKELSQVLDEIIACGERMIQAADAVKELLTEESNEPASAAEVPSVDPAKTYTFTDVRKAFSAKAHDGHTAEVKALIAKYGADRLSGVREDDYPSLMADLEAIG